MGNIRWNTARIREDMDDRGWLAIDLAHKTKLSQMTISLFLRDVRQSAPVALKIAKAFGYKSARRYKLGRVKDLAA